MQFVENTRLDPEVQKDDFQTPANVAHFMCDLLPVLSKNSVKILEPTPGNGNIVKALHSILSPLYNLEVIAPDDYWSLPKNGKYDAVIGNLPFSSKTFFGCPPEYNTSGMSVSYDQIYKLMEMTGILILLVPWFTLIDSDRRLKKFIDYGLVSITSLPRKTFAYTRIQTCVIHLQKDFNGVTEYSIFDCKKYPFK